MTELLVLEIKTRSRSERLLWENQKDLMEGVLLWCSGLGIGSISGPGNSTFHKHGKKKKKKRFNEKCIQISNLAHFKTTA